MDSPAQLTAMPAVREISPATTGQQPCFSDVSQRFCQSLANAAVMPFSAMRSTNACGCQWSSHCPHDGIIEVEVEVTTDIRPGVISLPHGWGHAQDTGLSRAKTTGGANVNAITDELVLDPLSGTSVLNGIPVSLAR